MSEQDVENIDPLVVRTVPPAVDNSTTTILELSGKISQRTRSKKHGGKITVKMSPHPMFQPNREKITLKTNNLFEYMIPHSASFESKITHSIYREDDVLDQVNTNKHNKVRVLHLLLEKEGLNINYQLPRLRRWVQNFDELIIESQKSTIHMPYCKSYLLCSKPFIKKYKENRTKTGKEYQNMQQVEEVHTEPCQLADIPLFKDYFWKKYHRLLYFGKEKIEMNGNYFKYADLTNFAVMYKYIWDNIFVFHKSMKVLVVYFCKRDMNEFWDNIHCLSRRLFFRKLQTLNFSFDDVHITRRDYEALIRRISKIITLRKVILSNLQYHHCMAPFLGHHIRELKLVNVVAKGGISLGGLRCLKRLTIIGDVREGYQVSKYHVFGIDKGIEYIDMEKANYKLRVGIKFVLDHPKLKTLKTRSENIAVALDILSTSMRDVTLDFATDNGLRDQSLKRMRIPLTGPKLHKQARILTHLLEKKLQKLTMVNYITFQPLFLMEKRQLRCLVLKNCKLANGGAFITDPKLKEVYLYDCQFTSHLSFPETLERVKISSKENQSGYMNGDPDGDILLEFGKESQLKSLVLEEQGGTIKRQGLLKGLKHLKIFIDRDSQATNFFVFDRHHQTPEDLRPEVQELYIDLAKQSGGRPVYHDMFKQYLEEYYELDPSLHNHYLSKSLDICFVSTRQKLDGHFGWHGQQHQFHGGNHVNWDKLHQNLPPMAIPAELAELAEQYRQQGKDKDKDTHDNNNTTECCAHAKQTSKSSTAAIERSGGKEKEKQFKRAEAQKKNARLAKEIASKCRQLWKRFKLNP